VRSLDVAVADLITDMLGEEVLVVLDRHRDASARDLAER
jgi:hypothetical protein